MGKSSRPNASPNLGTFDQTVVRHIEGGRWQTASDLLAALPSATPEQLNTRAVCLMRLGRFDHAMRVLQGLVLLPDCTWLRTDTPVTFRTNFATALLLTGNSLGVRDVLSEIDEKDHPSVVRLASVVKRWEFGLTPWQKLCWRFGFPPPTPITIDFEPGEFTWDVRTLGGQGATPSGKRPNPSAQAA